MNKETFSSQDKDNPVDREDILERYLTRFATRRNHVAIILSQDRGERVIATLDGTQLVTLDKLSERTGHSMEELKTYLDDGNIQVFKLGDIWLASKEAFSA